MGYGDYEKGRDGIGGGSGMDYLKGVAERERQRAEMAYKPPPPAPCGPDIPVIRFPDNSTTSSDRTSRNVSSASQAKSGGKTEWPELMVLMAQIGSMVGVPIGVTWACYSMVVAHHFDWTKLFGGVLLGGAEAHLRGRRSTWPCRP